MIFVSNDLGYLDKLADTILASGFEGESNQSKQMDELKLLRKPIDFFASYRFGKFGKNITLLRGRCSEVYQDWNQLDKPEIEALIIRNLMEPIFMN